MARNSVPRIDETSLPYRVVIDFLEGTLRKQDAVAFARGFIENHFESLSNSGYFVQPYEGGYIFEAHEGGTQRAYLPNILEALEKSPTASVCIQMARRVLEVKRSQSGIYTAILLPEGTESQNPDKVFPEPGPKLIPFQRSGMAALVAGAAIFGIGFLTLLLATVIYLVEISGLFMAPLPHVDFKDLPLAQWQSLENVGGEDSGTYIKALHYENGKWTSEMGQRQELSSAPETVAPAAPEAGTTPDTNPLAPPAMSVNSSAVKPATPVPGSLNSQPATAMPQTGLTAPTGQTAAPGTLPAPPNGTAR